MLFGLQRLRMFVPNRYKNYLPEYLPVVDSPKGIVAGTGTEVLP